MATSRTIGIGISSSVTNDTSAVTKASVPGISKPVKLERAASSALLPIAISRTMKLICCTPWETPMANTRKGTSTANGSSPYPNRRRLPNCHTSEASEQTSASSVKRSEWQYQYTAPAVRSNASKQNSSTAEAPSAMSPICLAKPMIWTSNSPSSNCWRISFSSLWLNAT